MLNTPLTELRRLAPRPTTHARLVEFFARRGLPRRITVFGNFERGEVKNPSERFVKLWAEAVGSSAEAVMEALRRTQRMRTNGTGPFRNRKSIGRTA